MSNLAPQPTSVTLEAKIIRADGRVEDLGTVAFWHRNPLRRLLWRLKTKVAGRSAGRVHQGVR